MVLCEASSGDRKDDEDSLVYNDRQCADSVHQLTQLLFCLRISV